jgi:6-phosphogluconolactonase
VGVSETPAGVRPATDEPTIVVRADPDAVASAAAEFIASRLSGAIEARGRADWATTGGSTPTRIYRHLVDGPARDAVGWSWVWLWWGDDRFVPHDHPLSNVQDAEEILLGISGRSGESGSGEQAFPDRPAGLAGVPIPAEQIHPFPTTAAIGEGQSSDWCAERYAETIRELGPVADADGRPVFDLVMLGMGEDGHILSVFPGSAAFDREELAMGIPPPAHIEPHVERVTLNPRVVSAAREVLVVVNGAAKASTVAAVFGAERDPRRWPAQLARRGGATWILDEPAASELRPSA